MSYVWVFTESIEFIDDSSVKVRPSKFRNGGVRVTTWYSVEFVKRVDAVAYRAGTDRSEILRDLGQDDVELDEKLERILNRRLHEKLAGRLEFERKMAEQRAKPPLDDWREQQRQQRAKRWRLENIGAMLRRSGSG